LLDNSCHFSSHIVISEDTWRELENTVEEKMKSDGQTGKVPEMRFTDHGLANGVQSNGSGTGKCILNHRRVYN